MVSGGIREGLKENQRIDVVAKEEMGRRDYSKYGRVIEDTLHS
jgi:hypothetical protein